MENDAKKLRKGTVKNAFVAVAAAARAGSSFEANRIQFLTLRELMKSGLGLVRREEEGSRLITPKQ